MKRNTGIYIGALSAILLGAGISGAQAQSSPHSIFYASKDVAILRTAAGYPTVLKRIDRFYERMVDTFTQFGGTIRTTDFYLTTLSNGEVNIMCRSRLILTVTRADARSYNTTPAMLAQRWVRGFAQTLPQSQQYVAQSTGSRQRSAHRS